MAGTIRSIRPVKQLTIKVKPNMKLDDLQKSLQRRFGALGCSTCLSGLNRFVIEDTIAGRFR